MVIVIGAGIAGLGAALVLARSGKKVIVCERDAAPVPISPERMWSSWPRRGTPQARLGHTFLAGFRKLLAKHAPDVLARVCEGAPLVDLAADMPGNRRRPWDDELNGIMCRRPVLEGILRQAVEAEPNVEVRSGCDVVGLLATRSNVLGVPKVTGVRTRTEGEISAESVIVAGGRSLPIRRWLDEIGTLLPEEESEGCGFVWFTRFFRVEKQPGEDNSVSTRIAVAEDLGFMKYEFFGADRSTFCVELGIPTWDHDLRAVRAEAAHLAVARALPEGVEWLDDDRATPIGGVAPMGQERNVFRRFVSDGRPVALGLHVIGDARCETNSAHAWGAGSALTQAATLADVLDEHEDDPSAQALAFEDAVGAELAALHAWSRARDRACLASYRGEVHGHLDEYGMLDAAARTDPDIFRAVTRAELQLARVTELLENGPIVDRARLLASDGRSDSTRGPTRESILGAIAAVPA